MDMGVPESLGSAFGSGLSCTLYMGFYIGARLNINNPIYLRCRHAHFFSEPKLSTREDGASGFGHLVAVLGDGYRDQHHKWFPIVPSLVL